MKCPNCDFEIEKPNLKRCPLCGFRIIPGAQSSDEKTVDGERNAVAPHLSSLSDSKPDETVEIEISDADEFFIEQPEDDPVQPFIPEQPVSRQVPEPEQESAPVYEAPPRPAPQPVRPPAPTVTACQDERITPEDPDQYLENGSYQPYPDEVADDFSYNDGSYPQPPQKGSSSWLAIVIAAVGGILIGSLLYFAI